MRIDRVARALACALAVAGSARAQDALSGVGPNTQVRSIEFRFEEAQSIQTEELFEQIALTQQGGMVGIRRLLRFLPFVPPIGQHPFDPFELQRDVVRLRTFYQESGFPKVDVRYDVKFDAEDDIVKVTFVITEGPPLLVRSIGFVTRDESPPALAPDIQEAWEEFVVQQQEDSIRLGRNERARLIDRTQRYLRNRGYPFADAEVRADVDTAANLAAVTVVVEPGPRARIDSVGVEGNETVPADHFVRQLPLRAGDWYSAGELEDGRRQIAQFDIVRLALLETGDELRADSTVPITLRITENPKRVVNASGGFASDGGLTTEAEWNNRSFRDGLRTLSLAVVAQSGLLAFEVPPQRLLRLAATLFQPYVGHRRLSLAGGPFAEYRDDVRDKSYAVGVDGSLVYAVGPLKNLSLGYQLSRRRVVEFRVAQEAGIDYLTPFGFADALGAEPDETFQRSTFTLSGTFGGLDDLVNPIRGYVLRPRFEITAPGGLNSSEYALVEGLATGFLPLGSRIGLAVRASAGRIYPFGGSIPEPGESEFEALQQLRDVTFTAGGTRDVRGFGSQLLGPKVPDVELDDDGDPFAERYAPVGGLARLSGTVELRLPIPGLADEWYGFLFAEGGRIWIPDRRFFSSDDPLDQQRFFSSAGAGFSYETIVGAVQLSVAYKLNPSALDVRPADEVFEAIAEGRPITSVPTDSRQRWHIHFSIGSTF